MIFSFDTETFLLRPGHGAPPMVCLQYVLDGAPAELVHARDPAAKHIFVSALVSQNVVLNGHNVAFDMAVAAATWPDLLELIFSAYEAGRVLCTKAREQLAHVARGIPMASQRYGLADLAKRHCGIELDKSDPWRLRYGTLYGTPVAQWPEEARAYALLDAETQDKVFRAQEPMPDEAARSRTAFWLRLMECHGVRTDVETVRRYHAQTLEQSEKDRATCVEHGLVRPNGSRDTKAAKARIEAAFTALGEKTPVTATGETSCDEDACVASGDEIMLAYQRFGSLKTILSRCERLYKGTELPLQASFQPLMETGRTSCRMGDVKPGESPPAWGFQLQNLPR